MPCYELALILRKMTRPELVDSLKRSGMAILKANGVLRKIENLGTKQLPYKMSVHDRVHKEGSYFLFYFNASPTILKDLNNSFMLDIDIIKASVSRLQQTKYPAECTLDEEFQPPALRKSVAKLLEESKKPKTKYVYRKYTDEI
ncbi:probable 28S ribosomal protein S6, mitochondrial [Centruroides sculpturatus]|uniref:probable 28S ribosomal protein S6, mitochondrial n=1 Tax=Centruroides sculpturatus TaxID=218467 RepID=UPI000C6D9BDD|nr:probable 28S ribosomal protein S6, mitochondrial [Centruroides sculpturatus]